MSGMSFAMCCSLGLCRTKFDEFLFLLPFPDLGHVSAVLFLPLSEFAQFHLTVPCELWNPP